MKAYLPHLWTILVAVVTLAVGGLTLSSGSVAMSFSGKHVETGWPLVYEKQDYLNTAAVATRIDEPPAPSKYVPKGEAEFDPFAFWVDVGVAVLIVVAPVALCEWFLRRRKRLVRQAEPSP